MSPFSTAHPRGCQPSLQILSGLELDLLAVNARAADLGDVLFLEGDVERPSALICSEGVVRALFPGGRALDDGGIVGDLALAMRRLLAGRQLLSRGQREPFFRDPWYAREGDCPPHQWCEKTRALRQTILDGSYELSAASFLYGRATEILEVANDLVAMHYAPAPPSGRTKARRRQGVRSPEMGHDAT